MHDPTEDPLQVLLWGESGTGKTVRAHTFPRTRTLDFDGGMLSVYWAIKKGIIDKDPEEIISARIREGEETDERGPYGFIKRPGALDRATDQIDEWVEDFDSWDTLIIDSATVLNEMCMLKGMQGMKSMGLSESFNKAQTAKMYIPRIQDYGAAKNMFKQFIDWVRSIDKNLIVICHQYEDTTASGIVRMYQPLLIGSLREEISKDFDEVWQSFVGEDKKGNRQFMIRTVGSKKYKCKSRLGCLDDEEAAFSYAEIMKKVEAFWGS